MSFSYTYTKVIDIFRLQQEIQQNIGITKALEGSPEFTPPTTAKIYFREELPQGQKDILDVIVENHVPTPLDAPQEVTLTELKTTDKRLIVKENKRPLLSNGFCTSRGENPSSPTVIGGGADVARYSHVVGEDTVYSYSKEIFFHVEGNRTWLMDGFIRYVGAKFDEFTFEIRPRVTTIQTGLTGTNYRVSGGYLLVPAPGTGTVSINTSTEFYPCSVTPKTDTGFNSTAYWNLDYNSSTNTYSNLTAASNPNSLGQAGNGKYNIITADVCLKRYINKWGLLGDGVEVFSSTDPSEFGSHLRAVFKFTTIGQPDPSQAMVDHTWSALVNFTMFREKIT